MKSDKYFGKFSKDSDLAKSQKRQRIVDKTLKEMAPIWKSILQKMKIHFKSESDRKQWERRRKAAAKAWES